MFHLNPNHLNLITSINIHNKLGLRLAKNVWHTICVVRRRVLCVDQVLFFFFFFFFFFFMWKLILGYNNVEQSMENSIGLDHDL